MLPMAAFSCVWVLRAGVFPPFYLDKSSGNGFVREKRKNIWPWPPGYVTLEPTLGGGIHGDP
jgi:hypothetical protein